MRIRHLRWYVAALLFTSTVINYIDRQTLSVVAPVLTKELHLSDIEYSYILQAFLVAYTVMYLVSGILVDRWGTRRALATFMCWWSVSNILHAIARTALHLGIFRFLLGVGEPGNYMAAGKAISEWYPAKEKAFVNGLVNAGSALGAVVAAPLVAWITVRYGWRPAFAATGCFGLLWLVPWLVFYHVPEKHARITPEELAHIRGTGVSPPGDEARMHWFELLKYRQTWGLLLARFVSDPVWWFYLFWMPKYLVEQRGFSMVQMGMLAWLPYLSADLGAIAGGLLSGYLVKRGWPALKARFGTMLPCALLTTLSVAIAFTRSSTAALLLICAVTFCHLAWKTNLMTITNDIYPAAVVGSVCGIVSLGSGLGGVLFTNLTGRIVEHGSYGWIFIIMAFLHPIAFFVCRGLTRNAPVLRAGRPAERDLDGAGLAANSVPARRR